ncbi:MAG: hypothetical protein AAFU77_03025 [Myxococcota bacterium]
MARLLMFVLILAGLLAPTACGVDPEVQCESDEQCFDGYACDPVGRTCLRACEAATESADCLSSQFCDVATGQSSGVCRAVSASVPDSQIR